MANPYADALNRAGIKPGMARAEIIDRLNQSGITADELPVSVVNHVIDMGSAPQQTPAPEEERGFMDSLSSIAESSRNRTIMPNPLTEQGRGEIADTGEAVLSTVADYTGDGALGSTPLPGNLELIRRVGNAMIPTKMPTYADVENKTAEGANSLLQLFKNPAMLGEMLLTPKGRKSGAVGMASMFDAGGRLEQGDIAGLVLDTALTKGGAGALSKTASKLSNASKKVPKAMLEGAANIGLGSKGGAKTVFESIQDIFSRGDEVGEQAFKATQKGQGGINDLKRTLETHVKDKNIEINDQFGQQLDAVMQEVGNAPVNTTSLVDRIFKKLEDDFNIEIRPATKQVEYSGGTMKMPRTVESSVTVQRPARRTTTQTTEDVTTQRPARRTTTQTTEDVTTPGARLRGEDVRTRSVRRRGRDIDVNEVVETESQGAPRTRRVTRENVTETPGAPRTRRVTRENVTERPSPEQEIATRKQIIEEVARADRIVNLPNGLEIEFKDFGSLVQGDRATASLIVDKLEELRKRPATVKDVKVILDQIKSITEDPAIGMASRGDKMLTSTIKGMGEELSSVAPQLKALDESHTLLRNNFDDLQREFSLSGKADADTIWKKLAEPFSASGITVNDKVALLKQLDAELGGQVLPLVLGEMTKPIMGQAAMSKFLQGGATTGAVMSATGLAGVPVTALMFVPVIASLSPRALSYAARLLGKAEGSKLLQMARQAGRIGAKATGNAAMGLGAADRFNDRGEDILTQLGRVQR